MVEKRFDLNLFVTDVLGQAQRVNEMLRRGFLQMAKDARQRRQDVETAIDLEVAHHWHRFLRAKYPFIDLDTEEEQTRVQTGSTYLVRCDSVDGSKHAKAGIDLFGSTMALSWRGEVVFAMVLNPLSGKVYHAVEGQGVFLNGEVIKVSKSSISEAFVFGELPVAPFGQKNEFQQAGKLRLFNRLLVNSFRLRFVGVGSLAMCWVAEGAAAAYLDFSGTTKLYDVEAAAFIARRAGAVVSDCKGNEIDWRRDSEVGGKRRVRVNLLVANPTAHREMLEVIRG